MTETQSKTRHLGYARLSTYGQTLEAQLAQLKAQGCSKIYREKASGAPADRQFKEGCENLDCVTDGKSAIAAIGVIPGGSLCASIDPILHNKVMAAAGGCRASTEDARIA